MSPEPISPPSGSPPPPLSTMAPILPIIPSDAALHDPPPPYPARERRSRQSRRTRRNANHTQVSSAGTESEGELLGSTVSGGIVVRTQQLQHPFPQSAEAAADETSSPTETTPLLPAPGSSSAAVNGIPRRIRRQRTASQTSTVFSVTSASPSLAQTVVSAFRLEGDSDDEDEEYDGGDESGTRTRRRSATGDTQVEAADMLGCEVGMSRRRASGVAQSGTSSWRKYFRPLWKRSSWAALFHIMVLNFPYALVAWIFLFVFTLVSFYLSQSVSRLPISDE